MRSILVLSAIAVSLTLAFDIVIVPEDQDCKVGQKYIHNEEDKFVKECKAVDNGDTYNDIIGCRSPDKKFFALGTSYNWHQREQLGFRIKCYLNNEGFYKYEIESCLMGKAMKIVKIGQKGVFMNQACTCNGKTIDCK